MTKSRDTRAEKRRKFAISKEKSRSPLPIILAAALIIVAGVSWAVASSRSPASSSSAASVQPTVVDDGTLRFALATFDDGKAHFYSHQVDGKTIEFFVLKSSDGVVRAAFNACDVCFLAKKGYRQDGDEMVCNNCGQRFPSHLINEVRGGCNPSPLERSIEGDQLVIRVEDIAAGAGYF